MAFGPCQTLWLPSCASDCAGGGQEAGPERPAFAALARAEAVPCAVLPNKRMQLTALHG
jgi:hypothetical protein